MSALTVVIADDDPRVTRDFRRLLELESDLSVVGVAADGQRAVDAAIELRPDVVVMDVRMPRMNGIDATRLITEQTPSRVLVVTTFDLDDYVLGAIRAGASGFLLKDDAIDQLAEAVRTVATGNGIVGPRATARLLRELVETRPVSSGTVSALTRRETEIVSLIAHGLTNDQIAAAAHVSRSTVKVHVSSVLAKLDLSSRLQVVIWAYENGLAHVRK